MNTMNNTRLVPEQSRYLAERWRSCRSLHIYMGPLPLMARSPFSLTILNNWSSGIWQEFRAATDFAYPSQNLIYA